MRRNNPPDLSNELSNQRGAPGNPTVAIVTQGCKLNQADSQVMAQEFANAGYLMVDAASGPRVLVVNTCTVTGSGDADSRRAVRRAVRFNPDATVVVTGVSCRQQVEHGTGAPALHLAEFLAQQLPD